MKTAFFGLKPWEEEYIKKHAEVQVAQDLTFLPGILDKDHLPEAKDFDILSVFVDSTLDAATLNIFPNLKMIAARSTGYDNIDLDYCRQKNIVVSTVPSYGENTVAEFAFGLILCLSRKIYQGVDRIRETGKFDFEGLQGFDLQGKTLGVIGTGRIGRHSVRIAKGFEMKIMAYDPYPNRQFAEAAGFSYLTFEEVLKQSDIVTIHVPYTKETHHLFNERTFQLMKRGAYLINTSRGGVVDTTALMVALKNGQLGGVGLDVLEEEGAIKDELSFLVKGSAEKHNLRTILANHVLFDLPNVVITPHNAFNTTEALQKILDTTAENIAAFLKGAPINMVKSD